jgi:AmmeMemoRadiSam system protein A
MKEIMLSILLSFFLFSDATAATAGEYRLNAREKMFLLNLARQTLYLYLKSGVIPQVEKGWLTEATEANRACFVTLKRRGLGLRGCIGMFASRYPLYSNVMDRAIAAATQDPRFPPVPYNELEDIKIEISVLTPPERLHFSSPPDLLQKLKPLRDGVIMTTPYGSSTFLPQVWEQLPDKEDFLSRLCMKHGAPANYWRIEYQNIQVQTYNAIVFGEAIYGRKVVGQNGAVVGKDGARPLGAVSPLPNDMEYGGYKVKEGTKLAPGAIVSADSDMHN